MKFATKPIRHYPPHLKRVATLPWEIKIQTFGRLSTVSVSRNVFNSLLTPRFVQRFSGNSSVNLFAVYAFIYKLFIKILSSLLNTMLIVDTHCSDVCCDEFLVLQIDRNSTQVKEQCHEKFYLQSVWENSLC